MNKTVSKTVSGKTSRAPLYMLFLVFCAPVMLSWGWFYFAETGHTGKTASHGDLVIPARPLPDVSLRDPGQMNSDARLHGKWTLFFINGGECSDQCRENLYRMQQVRLAMGKNAQRVQRAILIEKDISSGLVMKQLQGYPGQLIVRGDDVGTGFIDNFKFSGTDNPRTSARLYIIDPLGNLMMSYPPEAEPVGIIQDLKRMIRISRIG